MPNSDKQCHKVRISRNLEAKMQYFTIFAARKNIIFSKDRGPNSKRLYTEFSYLRPKKSIGATFLRCFTTSASVLHEFEN